MTRPVRIGVVIRFKNPEPWKRGWESVYRDNLEYAAAADRLGFDGVWVPEHHCVPSGYNPTPFVVLAAIAGVTRRCRIGTHPLLLPLHNPVLAAEEAAVVDILSGGRLVLCVAGGYREGDFEALGVPYKERGARTEEALALLVRALQGEAFDHQGRYFRATGVKLSPPPLQDPIQIQLAVQSVAAARRAMRHNVDVNLHSAEIALNLAPTLLEEAGKHGRSGRDVGVSIQCAGFIGRSREDAVEMCKPYLHWQTQEFATKQGWDPTIAVLADKQFEAVERGDGPYTASEWRDVINRDLDTIVACGLRPDWVNLTLWHAGMPLDQGLACLEQFAEEVLPHIDRPS